MRITLINPPLVSRERYGRDIGALGGHQAPLGLCYLAAFLEKNGIEVGLIDAEAEWLRNDEIVKRIKDFGPDVIGITSTTVAFHRAHSLASDIKSLDPNMPVIIGGPHLTANPLHTMSFGCFDYGVMHEGEITLIELLKALKSGAKVTDVEGIVYRKDGDIIFTARRPYIQDLDSLPFPARHLLPDVKRYVPPLGSYLKRPVISMVTSRGCPYGCIFCDNNIFGRTVRCHSPEYVVSEVEDATERYGAKEIAFLDDTFTFNMDRTKKILSLIGKKRIKIKWSCMTRADTVTEDMLQGMKDAGCWQVSIGAESGSQSVLNFVRKGTTTEQVKRAVSWCRQTGIYVKGFFMIGHPTDTVKTIDETIDFAKKTPFDDIVATIATPIPGTKFYSIASRYGTLRSEDWSEFSYWRPVFVPHGLNEKTLYSKQRQLYREFYLRTGVILRQLRKIHSVSQAFKYAIAAAKAILSLCDIRTRRL